MQNEDALLAIAQRIQRRLGRRICLATRVARRLLMKIEEKQRVIFGAPLADVRGEVFHVLRVEVDFGHAAEGGVKCRHIKGMLAGDHRGLDLLFGGTHAHKSSRARFNSSCTLTG